MRADALTVAGEHIHRRIPSHGKPVYGDGTQSGAPGGKNTLKN